MNLNTLKEDVPWLIRATKFIQIYDKNTILVKGRRCSAKSLLSSLPMTPSHYYDKSLKYLKGIADGRFYGPEDTKEQCICAIGEVNDFFSLDNIKLNPEASESELCLYLLDVLKDKDPTIDRFKAWQSDVSKCYLVLRTQVRLPTKEVYHLWWIKQKLDLERAELIQESTITPPTSQLVDL